MSSRKDQFCICPDFLYQNGKCAKCGNWIDDPKEYSKSKRLKYEIQNIVGGECDCLSPSINLDGICQKCLRKVAMTEPVVFFKEPKYVPDKTVVTSKSLDDQGESSLNDQKKFCINCGAELEKAANFCGVCGKSLSVPRNLNLKSNEKEILEISNESRGSMSYFQKSNHRSQHVVLGTGVVLLALIGFFAYNLFDGSAGGKSPNQDNNGKVRQEVNCRWVPIPNPAYRPAPPGISITEQLTYDNRRTIMVQKCS